MAVNGGDLAELVLVPTCKVPPLFEHTQKGRDAGELNGTASTLF